jgi:hypothetical protein
MARRCTICVRGDRARIDAALVSGSEATQTARTFHLSTDALLRHRNAGHVAGIAAAPKPKAVVSGLNPADVERLRPMATPPPKPRPTIEPTKLSLRSPEDVLEQLEWAVSETKALLEGAKAAGDLRLQDRLLQTALGALDKLAKSVGLYNDGVTINVDSRQTRIVEIYDSLPTDVLRRLAAGETTIEAVLEGAS